MWMSLDSHHLVFCLEQKWFTNARKDQRCTLKTWSTEISRKTSHPRMTTDLGSWFYNAIASVIGLQLLKPFRDALVKHIENSNDFMTLLPCRVISILSLQISRNARKRCKAGITMDIQWTFRKTAPLVCRGQHRRLTVIQPWRMHITWVKHPSLKRFVFFLFPVFFSFSSSFSTFDLVMMPSQTNSRIAISVDTVDAFKFLNIFGNLSRNFIFFFRSSFALVSHG